MPNALIVTAHPDTKSFNHALSNQMAEVFNEQGWTVSQSLLYQQKFNPLLDFSDITDSGSLAMRTIAQMQLAALHNKGFSEDIQREQNRLLDAELVMIQFPLWWGGFPAILKGWIERVCSYGFAYGPKKYLKGKQLILSVTTGGADNEQEHQYYLNKCETLAKEIFGYMQMDCLPSLISHGPGSKDETARQLLLASHREQLLSQLNTLHLTA